MIRVVLEEDGTTIEGAHLLLPINDITHTDLAEEDAVLKGINLVLGGGAYAD